MPKVTSKLAMLWLKDDSESGWETDSCADSSKSVYDEENSDQFQDTSHKRSNQQAGKKAQKPWRMSYLVEHPAQAYRILFGKMTDEDRAGTMQYWRNN